MADPVTSGINSIQVGEGKDKKTIYTATKTTPTTDAKGNKTYKVEIVQYDNAKGEGATVIGERDPNNPDLVLFNDDYPDELWSDGDATEKIKQQSQKQAQSIKNQVATTQEEKNEFNKANANGNQGTEAENEQAVAKLKNAASEISSSGGAGTPKPGTRNEGFPDPLVFPQSLRRDVANGQDFLKINMMKYAPKDFNEDKFSFSERNIDRKSIGSVVLPIPGGIQDGQSVNWGGSTMTPLDMVKADIAMSAVSEGLGQGVAKAGDAAQNLAGAMGENNKALAAVIASMAAGAGNLLTRTTGAITNPNMELLFGGPQLRTFNFQFQLAPRSRGEAMEAVKIIRFFKQGMAPIRTKSMLFLKSPHTFKLSYKGSDGDDHKYLNKFKECALGTFNVNYTPNGNYSTYEDGVMTAYQITMTFRELNPIYNDDYGSDPFPEEIGF